MLVEQCALMLIGPCALIRTNTLFYFPQMRFDSIQDLSLFDKKTGANSNTSPGESHFCTRAFQEDIGHIMRNFYTCENRDADQLCSNCTADQRLCFRYTDGTTPLLSRSKLSSLWPSSVLVQLGLCQICSKFTLVFS